jgi:hypothetical protein
MKDQSRYILIIIIIKRWRNRLLKKSRKISSESSKRNCDFDGYNILSLFFIVVLEFFYLYLTICCIQIYNIISFV